MKGNILEFAENPNSLSLKFGQILGDSCQELLPLPLPDPDFKAFLFRAHTFLTTQGPTRVPLRVHGELCLHPCARTEETENVKLKSLSLKSQYEPIVYRETNTTKSEVEKSPPLPLSVLPAYRNGVWASGCLDKILTRDNWGNYLPRYTSDS